MKPQQQPRDRCLAAAGSAQQAQHTTRSDAERDVSEDGLLLVRERHRIELQVQRARTQRPGPVTKARLDLQELADAGDAGERLLHVLELPADLLDRPSEELRVVEEEIDRPEGDRASHPERATDCECGGRAHCERHHGRGVDRGRPDRRPAACREPGAVVPAEFAHHV